MPVLLVVCLPPSTGYKRTGALAPGSDAMFDVIGHIIFWSCVAGGVAFLLYQQWRVSRGHDL